MLKVDPIRLAGEWREGYALDLHTSKALFLGYNQYDRPEFDTTYTSIGKLLHDLKYSNDRTAVAPIVETAVAILKQWKWDVDLMIPVPPSDESRASKPVISLASGIAEQMGLELCGDCITKGKKTDQIKSVEDYSQRVKLMKGAFTVTPSKVKGRKILLFDDLYRSGATLNEITAVLYKEGKVKDVYVLTITKTRSRS